MTAASLGKNKSALILAMQHEYKKQHYVYDGSGRMSVLYEAPLDTVDGGACLATKWAYSGSTTTITDTVEFEGTWTGAWDLTYP